jgi:phenylacetate-CoA ligase
MVHDLRQQELAAKELSVESPVVSVIDGIKWPALPATSGACRLGALFQLEQTQWWSVEKLRKHQFKQINILLRHCVQHVPYYRELLANSLGPEPLNEETWRNIPLLTRDKLQQAGDKLRATFLPPDHGKVQLQCSSGSTGKPVETLATDITSFFWNVFTMRDHLWHRRDFTGKLAVIRYIKDGSAKPPHGIHVNNWGYATTGIVETGGGVVLSILTPLDEQMAWLQREDPDYLLTHPSILQELALYSLREDIQLPSLREVRTISEAMPDGLRELCQKAWGVKLVDVYSSKELGYQAIQCPEHDHYHVQSEGVLLEVLDDAGNPCLPGQVGRVVATNLHNFATPLIRYELGDFVEVGEACPCGRGLPVIKRILGRYRNLITLPNGERRWPVFGMWDMLKIVPVRQFQAIQHSIEHIEFLLVLDRRLSDDEKQQLTKVFYSVLHPAMNITIHEVDNIPRSASGKYEEFVSRL